MAAGSSVQVLQRQKIASSGPCGLLEPLGPNYRFKMEINSFQGPTSEPYCLAITRAI